MIEKISHNGALLATIIHSGFQKDGIQFFSEEKDLLQVGQMSRPKGYKIVPHIHSKVKRSTEGTQEVLFVKKGKIRVDFFSQKKEFLESRTLHDGDIILFIDAGHAIEFLEDAVIAEVKNGPYVEGADKEKFKDNRIKQ